MRSLSILLSFVCASVVAHAEPIARKELIAKVVKNGAPERGIRKILDFMDQNLGKEFIQDVYECQGRSPEDLKVCDEKKRIPKTRKVVLEKRDYAVYIDFKLKSTEKRFFLINLKTGAVERFLVAHGRGSGIDAVASRFSNTKDSKQTSLGMYMTGGTYVGGYGLILRLYGLERSNDQAYNRDIVLHGATYANESFIKRKNPRTKLAWGRLGVSWGCPAVAVKIAKRIIPLLKGGSLIYHDHEQLVDEAQNGREVALPGIPIPPRPWPALEPIDPAEDAPPAL